MQHGIQVLPIQGTLRVPQEEWLRNVRPTKVQFLNNVHSGQHILIFRDASLPSYVADGSVTGTMNGAKLGGLLIYFTHYLT
ncbi:hypothetical protein RRF57_000108 [Xylaria bambusicola]|uniref:Uncharacterized protein n=1 Tax=Xylaria bambusicola TaxID=326684 RepID=A0AAN7YZA8_9PEZI